ncbi:hypothetical protein SEUCBS139899_002416 [Sporothrix eucalyptigena]|uniref:4'-phosphopantetheinyl transferase domain-containing protein n=1 Tax=Sporothrix eucalyptigena TaxID=1812306 RepID=A0ABP0B1I2_9PEZI
MSPVPTARVAASRVLPFALPQLHVGTDICRIERIYAILAKPEAGPLSHLARSQTNASRFIRRVLTRTEIDALGPAQPLDALATASSHAVVAWLAHGKTLTLTTPLNIPTKAPNASSPLWRAAQFLASRFAAKEAAIKAHPHLRGLTLQDIRIARMYEGSPEAEDALARKGSGAPVAYVRVPSTATTDGDGGEIVEQEARLSISHDGEYATAVCLGVEQS